MSSASLVSSDPELTGQGSSTLLRRRGEHLAVKGAWPLAGGNVLDSPISQVPDRRIHSEGPLAKRD